jgi:hypothetical protein
MAGRDLLADEPPKGRDLLADDPDLLPSEGEDKPGWDWLQNNHPNIFQGIREPLVGIAKGVGNLPNVIPNVVNRANEIYHLHADEPDAPPPEPVMDQWMTGAGPYDKSIEEMNPPQAPGWEGWRNYGEMTGTALPAGLGAAFVVPALAKIGSGVGSVADYFYGDPAIREQPIQDYMLGDAEQGKWSQTAEFAAPLAAGGVVKSGKAAANSPRAAAIGEGLTKASGPIAALATLAKTGDLTNAYVAGKAAPATLRAAGRVGSAVMPWLKPVTDLVGGPAINSLSGVADVLARSFTPAAGAEERRRGPR